MERNEVYTRGYFERWETMGGDEKQHELLGRPGLIILLVYEDGSYRINFYTADDWNHGVDTGKGIMGLLNGRFVLQTKKYVYSFELDDDCMPNDVRDKMIKHFADKFGKGA